VENAVSNLVNLLKIVAVLLAASMLGKWFLAEFKIARDKGAPWYQPYFSIPGILVLSALLLLPLIFWITQR
jgi:hypothetical protein